MEEAPLVPPLVIDDDEDEFYCAIDLSQQEELV
jgi:hypothetical protein